MENGFILADDSLFRIGYRIWQSIVWLRKTHEFRGQYNIRITGMARAETVKEKFLGRKKGWYACTIRPKGIRVDNKVTPATQGMNYAAIINYREKEIRLITVANTDEELLSKGFTRVPMEVESPEMLVARLYSEEE